jgi:hypothetical protein
MKRQRSNAKKDPPALIALRRAAKEAIAIARLTNTPAYVLREGRIVDAAKRPAKKTERKVSKKR